MQEYVQPVVGVDVVRGERFYTQLRSRVAVWLAERKIDGNKREYLMLLPDLLAMLIRLILTTTPFRATSAVAPVMIAMRGSLAVHVRAQGSLRRASSCFDRRPGAPGDTSRDDALAINATSGRA